MKFLTTILFVCIGISGFSQSQIELNKEAHQNYIEADKKLNDVYKKILVQKNEDSLFIQHLKKSQRIWISFRDSEVALLFSDTSSAEYGSTLPMCKSLFLEEITIKRIADLEKILQNNYDNCN